MTWEVDQQYLCQILGMYLESKKIRKIKFSDFFYYIFFEIYRKNIIVT